MKEINKILVPTDFSNTAEKAFYYALWFADHYEAKIELLHVIYPETEPLDFPVMITRMTQKKIEKLKARMQDFVQTYLSKVRIIHPLKHDPRIELDVEVGAPGRLIAEIARRDQVDLIIMGTQGEHSRVEQMFGSVAMHSLNKAPCSILIVPEHAQVERLDKVVYAVDLTDADPYHIWELGKLLRPFNIILRVVHVREKPNEKHPLSIGDLRLFFQEHAPALRIEFHEVIGKGVTDELVELSKNWEADLLVMHKIERGFIENLFHRSITREAALHASTPLLILK